MPVVELSVTDDSQLGSLESLLKREIPEAAVRRLSSGPEPGSLGWEDILTLAFTGASALADAIELIRSYLDAQDHETGVTITAASTSKRRAKTLTVRGATPEQVKEFIDWLDDE